MAKRPREQEDAIVRLNVGGRVFSVLKSTLTKFPDSLLAKMFSASWNAENDIYVEGVRYVDRSPRVFEHVIEALRTCASPLDYSGWVGFVERNAWRDELLFYGLGDCERPLYRQVVEDATLTCQRFARSLAFKLSGTPLYKKLMRGMAARLRHEMVIEFATGALEIEAGDYKMDAAEWVAHMIVWANREAYDAEDDDPFQILGPGAEAEKNFASDQVAEALGAAEVNFAVVSRGKPGAPILDLHLTTESVPENVTGTVRLQIVWPVIKCSA